MQRVKVITAPMSSFEVRVNQFLQELSYYPLTKTFKDIKFSAIELDSVLHGVCMILYEVPDTTSS